MQSVSNWRAARRDLLVLLGIAVLTTLVFWTTDLDLRIASAFYHPEPGGRAWPEGDSALWQFFYKATAVLAAALIIGSLAVHVYATRRAGKRWLQPYAALVLFTVLLGPGLLVNSLMKENWGRPRPRQVEVFGGELAYVPPLMPGVRGVGKGFPSGHAAVWFSLASFYYVWRRRRPPLARTMLVAGIVLGLTQGLGRIAAGGHFASDIIWAGLVTLGVAWFLYYFVLELHRDSGPPDAGRSPMR